MEKKWRLFLALILSLNLLSCASSSVSENSQSADAANEDDALTLDEESPQDGENKSSQASSEPKAEKSGGDELTLDEEFESAENTGQNTAENTGENTAEKTAEGGNSEVMNSATPPQEEVVQLDEDPSFSDSNSSPSDSALSKAEIQSIDLKKSSGGEALSIKGNQELNYTTRRGEQPQQFIVEIQGANLPSHLEKQLMGQSEKSGIDVVDIYKNQENQSVQVVFTLKAGASEPTIDKEGQNLVVISSYSPQNLRNDGSEFSSNSSLETPENRENLVLPVSKLEEYLAGNTRFYGKKISIEMSDMTVKEALQFIMEESGMNMVISDRVDGKISLRLRQVPWDQALVIVMKAKNLGYTRQGNVLQIATLEELRREEEDAIKMAGERKKAAPMSVRMFPVSYASVTDLEKKIKDLVGDRGKVIADARTNAIIITDTDENLERIAQFIKSIDVRPSQVLIEGKIVEAKESFTRAVGIRWDSSGTDLRIGQTKRGPVNMKPALGINSSYNNSGNLNLNLSIGTLDILGNLNAALSLREFEEQVKVISSPRAMVLTNETALISQTQEVPVRQVTQNGSSTQETFQFKPLALKMEVTPQVTAEGGVLMKVAVSRQIRGAEVGSGSSTAFSVDSREANTRVLVHNGQTAVIGGIFNSEMTLGKEGVPWLQELPLLGSLFRTRNESKSKTELLVFITPRVISPTDISPQ